MNYFLILFFGFIISIQAKFVLRVRIYNYKNKDDIKHDGSRCENFHWVGDKCDPVFTVCVTADAPCDLLNKKQVKWKNMDTVSTILNRDIDLYTLPKGLPVLLPREISIVVQVDDEDSVTSHDHIAKFSSTFDIKNLNTLYQENMKRIPKDLNVHLQASVHLKCSKGYTGSDCGQRIDEILCNSNCGRGKCVRDTKSDKIQCKCDNGWNGKFCQNFQTNNCTLLKCNPICTNIGNEKTCNCTTGEKYFMSCKEKSIITTLSTKLSTSTSSTICTTTTTTATTTTTSTSTSKKLSTPSTSTTKKLSTPEYRFTSKSFQIITEKNEVRSTSRQMIITEKSHESQKLSDKDKSEKDEKINNEKIIMVSHSPSTIIIICLLLLLCICVISLSIVIRNWQKRNKLNATHIQRPLPPILFQRTNNPSLPLQPSVRKNPDLQSSIRSEYETCTIPFKYPNHNASKSEIEPVDPYEEPIIYNMDSLTIETQCYESDDSDIYEKPIKTTKD